VSWGTRIFAALVFFLAVGALAAFVVLVLPQQIATLSQSEAKELATARQGATDAGASADALWTAVGKTGSMSLSADRLQQEISRAQLTEKTAEDALGHVQLAEGYLAQIDGIPFQLHASAVVSTDRPTLLHLEKALSAVIKLAHGATLQLTIARHVNQDIQTIAGPLNQSLAAHDWATVSRTAATIQQDLKSQETPAADPEALLDPLWTNWMDAMVGYAATAQQYSLSSAAGQSQTAQQLARGMAVATDQIGAAFRAAQANAQAWQQKTVEPLRDSFLKELAAAG
jgi:hypothetical protein